jgi:hypothetical protein
MANREYNNFPEEAPMEPLSPPTADVPAGDTTEEPDPVHRSKGTQMPIQNSSSTANNLQHWRIREGEKCMNPLHRGQTGYSINSQRPQLLPTTFPDG